VEAGASGPVSDTDAGPPPPQPIPPDSAPARALDREKLSALVADAAQTFSTADRDLSTARATLIAQYGGIVLMVAGVGLVSTALAPRRKGSGRPKSS
jgi:hypothetical protein